MSERIGNWLEADVSRSKTGKTLIWELYSRKPDPAILPDALLGRIRWYGAWRKYVFWPEDASLFDAACLRAIADFCEAKTREHREART